MDTMLSVAAIHIGARSSPDSLNCTHVTYYRDKALYNIRKATMTLSNQNLRALHMASMLLATTSLAADKTLNYPGLWVTNWLAMASGPRILTEWRPSTPQETPKGDEPPARVHAPGIAPDRVTPAIMPIDIERLLVIGEDEEDWQHRGALREAATGIAELFGAVCLDPEGGILVHFKVRAWAFSLTSNYFIDLVRQARPAH